MRRPVTIPPLEFTLEQAVRAILDSKTKPRGSLGRLEELALRISLIQGTLRPALKRPVALIFAGDHGLSAEGVSAYPKDVTWQMVYNFLSGGAAINVLARQHGVEVTVVDAGVDHQFDEHPALISAKIARGTRSSLSNHAMTRVECEEAVERGIHIIRERVDPCSNVLLLGEMGIANTSAASLIMSGLCELPVSECVGRGTGLDDQGFARKLRVLELVRERHTLDPRDPIGVLTAVGGYEIAMMCGAILGAAERRSVIVIDGFIVSAALLAAHALDPRVLDYCICAHRSSEQSHSQLLSHLRQSPLLDLGLRLGEGTGAMLAYPLLESAVRVINEMATFESAHVSSVSA